MKIIAQASTVVSDERLWRLSCEGDREAFTRIVERYQSLICSLAYSACGALGASEDMAQETFITAWRRLKELREPSKLRQWLCGIVRNIAANAVRRELRRGGAPESLEAVSEEPSLECDPASETITREEEALLWRTLSQMPESFREPLILFYREENSVAEVARQLDLSEEAVKQRLSRGRAMLRVEMANVVESTLSRTKPGRGFTVGVLVALPIVAASTASAAFTAGAAAKTTAGTAGKGILAKLGFGAFMGPVIGLILTWLGTRAAAATARSKAERACVIRYACGITLFCVIMSIGLVALLSQAGKLYVATTVGVTLGVCAWTAVLVGVVMFLCQRLDREVKRIRVETNTADSGSVELSSAGSTQTQHSPPRSDCSDM
jgi:RNA polymerase sigma factor (sigma-70 family)